MMMKTIQFLFLLAALLFATSGLAETHRLPSNTLFQYELPSDRWQVSSEPPTLAIDAMYVDLVHGKNEKGEDYDPVKLRAMAEKFMKTNNLYIYNKNTEAYLMVSISPYNEKSGVPNKKSVRKSAEWSLEAIEDHSHVEDFSPYTSKLEVIEVKGMKYAFKIDSDSPLFGEPHHFIGIIGFSHPYWVFMYYNDKVKENGDLEEMRQILSTFSFDRL